MEQHPDTIALEMITDAEAEPFLALSDVESHRRTAEYKGHKKQLEELGESEPNLGAPLAHSGPT